MRKRHRLQKLAPSQTQFANSSKTGSNSTPGSTLRTMLLNQPIRLGRA